MGLSVGLDGSLPSCVDCICGITSSSAVKHVAGGCHSSDPIRRLAHPYTVSFCVGLRIHCVGLWFGGMLG